MTRTIFLPGIALPVSAICLGTAVHGSQIPVDDAFALLDAYAERGGNFLDSAHVYAAWLPGGDGASERTIGAWMRSRGNRDSIVVATKGAHPPMSGPARSRLRPEDIASDIDDSLGRLGIDSIDLYWLHRDDPAVPIAEILQAVQAEIDRGRIRAIGASNWRPARLREAADHAPTNVTKKLTPFCASQISWNLRQATAKPWQAHETLEMDDEAMAFHRASRLLQIPYSSQAGGFFAKPLPAHASTVDAARWQRVAELVRRRAASPNAIALAYVLDHPCGGCAIVGSRTLAQLADSMDAARVRLTRDEVSWLATGSPA